jgi:hypothetical protein
MRTCLTNWLKYAREALDAHVPDSILDSNADSRRFNPEFEKWCANRSLELVRCLGAATDYLGDFGALPIDRRSIPLLRSALTAASAGFVLTATSMLALIGDSDSIPLIARASERFPSGEAEMFARASTDFADPAVTALFDRFLKNPEDLARAREEWSRKHDKLDRKLGPTDPSR